MDLIRLLVVEDNPDDAILIREFLVKEFSGQYRSEVVTSLAAAITVLTDGSFDAVLLDLGLPDSPGLDAVRQLVSRFPEVALIALTGRNDDKIAVQSVRYGAQDYLEKKDICSMWLSRAIRYAMERKKFMHQKGELLADLNAALEEIEILKKVIPICGGCKKIRNDRNEWEPVANYIKKKIGADLNNSICPECRTSLYSEMRNTRENQTNDWEALCFPESQNSERN
jgi:CheY-like chemotaxis protein